MVRGRSRVCHLHPRPLCGGGRPPHGCHDQPRGQGDEGEIAAFEADGGVVLAEPNGFAGTLDEVIARLSKDTAAATVFYNVNLDQQFVYAEDRVVVTAFEPDQPDSRCCAANPSH
ncbi:DUF6461 domain-containing protein [Streptosporangium sp. NPDC000396]|uniref:DUF6461 domain-containing protein n=1 Tax=Streptosporangium sp. NPDC000396 TaxID=3366185 RepID=UPI0036A36E75